MNERIDELMIQAGARFEFLHGVHYDDFQYRKFAELIVKECIETVAENMYSGMTHSDFSDGADFAYAQAISDIKEHFGVEE